MAPGGTPSRVLLSWRCVRETNVRLVIASGQTNRQRAPLLPASVGPHSGIGVRQPILPGMSSPRAFLAALASVRAFLIAFLGCLGWFIWAETHQTNGSCYDWSHYLPSAAITLAVIVALTVASRRSWRGRSASTLVGEGVAGAGWAALGLLVAIFFAAATSCSA
jgi:hypothetical protein